MKSFTRGLAMAGLLLLGACATGPTAAEGTTCTCGTVQAAINGCHDPNCVAGRNNPDNPECYCAGINTEIAAGELGP